MSDQLLINIKRGWRMFSFSLQIPSFDYDVVVMGTGLEGVFGATYPSWSLPYFCLP